jgi:cystathionine gamma-synthase/methionine-gamma-lyase
MSSIFTQSVHAGERPSRPDYTPTVTPIYNSVVYLYDDIDRLHRVLAGEPGYVYSRYGNPTVAALEEAVATLERGDVAVAFASGMAALHAALLAAGLRSGDTVVAARDLYGGTHALLNEVLAPLGVRTRLVEIARPAEVVAALEEAHPRIFLLETISNPLLVVPDLPVLAEAARQVGARVIVDSTFATPYLLCPLAYGADIVVHSLTKYLAGHDDVLGGIVVTNDELGAAVRLQAQVVGANLGPNEAWLAHRGLKTLALRMRAHCENAARVAAWLEGHPRVRRVYYPGLASHPQHAVAQQLFRPGGFGGMVSFELVVGASLAAPLQTGPVSSQEAADSGRPIGANGVAEAAIAFMERLKLILPGTTLGCIHSLILHPASTSHRALKPEQRVAWGISEGLLRLSVGIEEAEEIVADLEQAL